MSLISRKSDYALLILAYLHHHPEPSCSRTISTHYRLSQGFIANILKELCNQGFVISQRGIKGGYQLQRPLSEIFLVDLLVAMGDQFQLTNCSGENVDSSQDCTLSGTCPIQAPMVAIHHRILKFLKNVSLEELIGSSVENSINHSSDTVSAITLNLPLPSALNKRGSAFNLLENTTKDPSDSCSITALDGIEYENGSRSDCNESANRCTIKNHSAHIISEQMQDCPDSSEQIAGDLSKETINPFRGVVKSFVGG